MVAVPDRLEQRVREAQRQQVLDRLLAQVVVDAEDVVGAEDGVDQLVELAAGGQVLAEGLLDDDPAPPVGGALRHAGAFHLLEDDGEQRRRDGEVEGGVAPDPVAALQLPEGGGEGVEGVVVVERALHERDVGGELLPDLLAPRRAGVLPGGRARQLGEVLVLPVAPGEPEQREVGRQQAPVGQVVDGREQLLAGQVTGDAEDDERARLGYPRQSPVPRIAQRIGDHRGPRSGEKVMVRPRGRCGPGPGDGLRPTPPAAARCRRSGRSGAGAGGAGPGRRAPSGRRRPARPAGCRTCTAGRAPADRRPRRR